MKEQLITEVQQQMLPYLNNEQLQKLREAMEYCLHGMEIITTDHRQTQEQPDAISAFIAAKRIEGCSEKTLNYYRKTIDSMVTGIGKTPAQITTDDLRRYLTDYQVRRKSSRVTIDNIRRILSTFFSWLEDEDYIVKSPIRRIHKVKTAKILKDTYTDEALELMRDRKIYTAFCKCPDELQIKILERAGFSTQGFNEQLHIHKWIELLRADIETYQLGRDVLYDGAKYFHRGFSRYREEPWGETREIYCFDAINNTNSLVQAFRENGKIDISDYIDEYFYYFLNAPEGKEIDKKPIPPIDYVWDVQDLGGGTEKNMCMWVTELIINLCVVIHNSNIHKVDTNTSHRNYTGAIPETFEDAYYEALQWLCLAYSNFDV